MVCYAAESNSGERWSDVEVNLSASGLFSAPPSLSSSYPDWHRCPPHPADCHTNRKWDSRTYLLPGGLDLIRCPLYLSPSLYLSALPFIPSLHSSVSLSFSPVCASYRSDSGSRPSWTCVQNTTRATAPWPCPAWRLLALWAGWVSPGGWLMARGGDPPWRTS